MRAKAAVGCWGAAMCPDRPLHANCSMVETPTADLQSFKLAAAKPSLDQSAVSTDPYAQCSAGFNQIGTRSVSEPRSKETGTGTMRSRGSSVPFGCTKLTKW